MRVLFATSEVYPLAKTGGLADVSRALPIYLRRQGIDVRIVMPGYNDAIRQLKNPRIETRPDPILGIENSALISGELPGCDVPVSLIYAPALYSRAGGIYQDDDCRDWEDNPRRFAYFAKIATDVALGRFSDWKADLVHAHDWHAGLVPFFLSLVDGPRPPVVFTVHNLAFQGMFPCSALAQTGIPGRFFSPDGVEFYGHLSFLKAALRYSDKITTVSPRYAREILTSEGGSGLDGLLRSREKDLTGILNGIDSVLWNPGTDPAIVQPYSSRDIGGKRVCKADLQARLGLEMAPEKPLLGFVSRLTRQKMADALLQCAPGILATGAQLAVIAQGDSDLEQGFRQLAGSYPGQLSTQPYDEDMAHRLHAGADILLAPARFEPCGLTQMYGLRYGAVPIVRRTGGLADTVVNAQRDTLADETATGFVFEEATCQALMEAVARALELFNQPLAWRRIQVSGMNQDFGWDRSAVAYASLYEETVGKPKHSKILDGGDGFHRKLHAASLS